MSRGGIRYCLGFSFCRGRLVSPQRPPPRQKGAGRSPRLMGGASQPRPTDGETLRSLAQQMARRFAENAEGTRDAPGALCALR